jgi:DNA-binding transcriptional MocR family regulator
MIESAMPGLEGERLYVRLAEQVTRLIEEGTLRPGDRLPSVRHQSRRQDVSITTVLEAYRVLESDGWIEARPQSGYFVSCRVTHRPAEPECSTPRPDPTPVSNSELCLRVLRDTRNPHLVQLGATVPDPAMLPYERLNRIQAALGRRLGGESVAYDTPPGCRELRVQLARRAMEAGCELSPDEIVTTFGCQEAVTLALRAVCRPGDTVAIESPAYYGIFQALELLGLRALELPQHPRHGLRVDALRAALNQHPIHACLFSNFSNPIGACMPDEARRELVELLAGRGIPIIEDDIYGDLSFEAPRPRVARAYDRNGMVLLCSSFSKTLAPGYRVGWIAPGRFFRQVEHLKFFSSLSTATQPQLAVAEFLAGGWYERHLRRIRPIYARHVALVAQAVARHFPAGSRATRPEGSFIVWVELPERVDSLQLYQEALAEGITFAPGPIFSATGGYRNYLRLNAASWNPRIEAAIARLGALARATS